MAMQNMAPLLLADAAATPVTHTYQPAARIAENTARWSDSEHNSGVLFGRSTVTLQVKEATAPGALNRVTLTLKDPKVDFSVPSAPKLIGINAISLEARFIQESSDQERKDILQKFRNALQLLGGSQLGDNIAGVYTPY